VRSKKSTKKFLETQSDILFIAQLFLGLIVFFSIYGTQLMGPFGRGIYFLGQRLFSDAFPLVPWVLFFTAPALLKNKSRKLKYYFIFLSVFSLSFLTFVDSFFIQVLMLEHGKEIGTMSDAFMHLLSAVFGVVGARMLLGFSWLVFGLLLYNIPLSTFKLSLGTKKQRKALFKRIKYALFYTKVTKKAKKKQVVLSKKRSDNTLRAIQENQLPFVPPQEVNIHNAQDLAVSNIKPIEKKTISIEPVNNEDYVIPPLDLLNKARKSNAKQMEADMKEKSKVLEMTLDSFNVSARVVNITIGPAVSRFELQPGDGVKISKITNLNQDIALKLAVPTVRIEAPIPGKALIGIEVPNVDIAPLNLRSIINASSFIQSKHPLECVLGQRITGEAVTMNLNKMPHILVAGATGSGKSVCVNSIILSILLKATPDEVKFLMIDPKKVELSLYADIPHLLAPVVTNPHKAAATLKQWALVEMERRYELFTEHGVKDLAGFNAKAKKSKDLDPIPYIVVIIDEFADLMMVASQEVESTICRLAQMARATGIHLVIATQRPSVNVVTGLIKANVPSRISFAVQSQIDSRTVLDMMGAEKLLGRGDMLYMPVGAPKPDRVQGVFVAEEEVKAVVKFIKRQGGPNYVDEIDDIQPLEDTAAATPAADDDKDALFVQAQELIQSTQYASTSYLQRKLRIGYNRAARLMDELEEAGVISAYDGDKKTRMVNPNTEPMAAG
jgi:DNA segregation ATPase FtsK/SpoIIIE, S-DNA-T family